MMINDPVYGKEEIKEPVLIELINSAPMQRLKGVSQFGMPDEYYHKKGFSRYEHSIGVLVLLRRLGADLEEQISGLLHDVSHTAFSHLIDWIYGNQANEDYQDKTLFEVIERTEIKEILEKHGFDYRKIADVKKYPLLEQDAPHLCADRVDYSLREIALIYDVKDALKIFNSLKNTAGKMVFDSLESSKLFAEYYTKMNKEHWTAAQFNAEWHILTNVLKNALKDNIISMDDFMKTDREIISKLKKSGKTEIISGLNLLEDGFRLRKSTSSQGIILRKKSRYIDPEVLHKGKITTLSILSPDYKQIIDAEKKNKIVEMSVEILPLK